MYRETSLGGINYIFLGDKLVAKEGTGVTVPNEANNETSIANYKPFGESLETPRDEVGYTGHKFDTDLGLSYMQARYYDPVIGRFYSNDPLGFRDIHSFNRYAYANNNPYKYTDPTGQASEFSYINRPMGVSVADNLAVTSEAAGNAIAAVDTASDIAMPVKGAIKQGIKQAIKKSCCFVAGTQVLTEGGYKNIEDVKLGEKLWAKNTDTGEQEWKPVTKVFVEPDRGIFEVKLLGEKDIEQKIEATDDHPFYVVGKGWKQTIELKVGDLIETDGHGSMKVVSVTDEKRLDLTYNFTVADFHTYYVTKKNVLVHNCNKKKRIGSSKNEAHGDGGRGSIKG